MLAAAGALVVTAGVVGHSHSDSDEENQRIHLYPSRGGQPDPHYGNAGRLDRVVTSLGDGTRICTFCLVALPDRHSVRFTWVTPHRAPTTSTSELACGDPPTSFLPPIWRAARLCSPQKTGAKVEAVSRFMETERCRNTVGLVRRLDV